MIAESPSGSGVAGPASSAGEEELGASALDCKAVEDRACSMPGYRFDRQGVFGGESRMEEEASSL